MPKLARAARSKVGNGPGKGLQDQPGPCEEGSCGALLCGKGQVLTQSRVIRPTGSDDTFACCHVFCDHRLYEWGLETGAGEGGVGTQAADMQGPGAEAGGGAE